MKTILVYVNPRKDFDEESRALIKVQIDNDLELGWKTEDIILLTNFAYEYRGVKSLSVDDTVYCSYSPISTKIPAIISMFAMELLEKDTVYWAHDLDAFQLVPIPETEIEFKDIGLCDYGRMPKWAGGSVFFRTSAKDIFENVKKLMDHYQTVDEVALYLLTTEQEEIRNRVTKLNISYNFLPYNLRSCYNMAIKPIRVAHFHPLRAHTKMGIKKQLDFYKGDNKINTPLITERLVNILSRHGVE